MTKIRVYIKDPDGFYDAVREQARSEIPAEMEDSSLYDDLIDEKEEGIYGALERWVEFRESFTVEFDLAAGTATVVEKRD